MAWNLQEAKEKSSDLLKYTRLGIVSMVMSGMTM